MAEFAMWGPEQAGERIAELDRVKMGLDRMRALHTAGEIQKQPFEVQHLQAQTRLAGAKAGAEEFQLEATKKWSQAISSYGTGEGDPLEQMDFLGIEAMKAGLPEMGQKLLSTSSLVRARRASEVLRMGQAARQEVLNVRDQATMVGNLAATVTDQASLDRARALAQRQGLDVADIPLDYASAAPIIEQMRLAAIGAKGQAELQLKEIDQQERKIDKTDLQATRASAREYRRIQAELAQRREERLRQNAGSVIGSPSSADTLAAKRILKEAGIELEGADKDVAARSIAAEAKAMVKQNRGLDIDQATRQAIARAAERGDFQRLPSWRDKVPGATALFGKPSKFFGAGRTPQVPIPLVPSDVAKRVEGRYYVTPKGVLQWHKQGWTQPAYGLTGPVAADPDAKEEDE